MALYERVESVRDCLSDAMESDGDANIPYIKGTIARAIRELDGVLKDISSAAGEVEGMRKSLGYLRFLEDKQKVALSVLQMDGGMKPWA